MTNDQTKPQGIAWSHPAFLISTWFGLGKIPFAPGTFGSLGAFPLFIASHYLLCLGHSPLSFSLIYAGFIAVLFIVGQIATSIYMKKTGTSDPGEVVIDEVVAQLIVFFVTFAAIAPFLGIYDILYGSASADSPRVTVDSLYELLSIPLVVSGYTYIMLPAYVAGFILFRIFDILKPWPIRWCDKNIKGSFGVMFDDILAAIFAIIIMAAIGYGFIWLLPYIFTPPVQPEIPQTEIIQ